MIVVLLKILAATLAVIFFHELGHIGTYKYFKGRLPAMRFKDGCFEVDGYGLSVRQARWFVVNGILAGWLFIIFLLDVFQTYIIVAFILAYLWGCRDDFKELERLRKCV